MCARCMVTREGPPLNVFFWGGRGTLPGAPLYDVSAEKAQLDEKVKALDLCFSFYFSDSSVHTLTFFITTALLSTHCNVRVKSLLVT